LSLSIQQVAKLQRIISLAQKLIADQPKQNGKPKRKTRLRRTGKELVQFRRLLKSERRKGISVANIARRHGVSEAYIYMLR
jgi:hypothetical protein